MAIHVIGAGTGRTGTYSLKLALERLGFGPCHHMEEVLQKPPVQVPLWTSAVNGQPNWTAIYEGYRSAVDWPTAAFFEELSSAYPSAKFVLTVRSPESWVQSFSATIYKLMAERERFPAEMQPWFEMALGVLDKSGFPAGLDEVGLEKAFNAHNEKVRASIPADRLLTFEVKDGWRPLCDFLGQPVPQEPFPRSNDRNEFWDLVPGGNA